MADSMLDKAAVMLGPQVRRNEPLAGYTSMRVGGPADLLLVCENVAEVRQAIAVADACGLPWLVLGSGCNVLVADRGIRGLVIVYRASGVAFSEDHLVSRPWVRAEAGAQIALVARAAIARGLAGLEWATGLPGTVGGAVVGNAGAFGGDVAGTLLSAQLLEADGSVVERPVEWFAFDYRTSCLKRQPVGQRRTVLLAASFNLQPGNPAALEQRAAEILEWRQTRHPSGATMGSTFKNPPGTHAGYLIEQAGLRGYRIGGAQISEKHGNFFMNVGHATAADVLALIEHARNEVLRQFGVELELEIELLGW